MLTVRPMTETEFEAFRRETAEGYAAIQVEAGVWTAENALDRAFEETARNLPDGLRTADTLLLVALDGETVVGRLWISLRPSRGVAGRAFLYDIAVVEGLRGKGYGRALLAAAEDAARAAGAGTLALNVHGTNTRAIRLYETSGYTVMTQQMTKPL